MNKEEYEKLIGSMSKEEYEEFKNLTGLMSKEEYEKITEPLLENFATNMDKLSKKLLYIMRVLVLTGLYALFFSFLNFHFLDLLSNNLLITLTNNDREIVNFTVLILSLSLECYMLSNLTKIIKNDFINSQKYDFIYKRSKKKIHNYLEIIIIIAIPVGLLIQLVLSYIFTLYPHSATAILIKSSIIGIFLILSTSLSFALITYKIIRNSSILLEKDIHETKFAILIKNLKEYFIPVIALTVSIIALLK